MLESKVVNSVWCVEAGGNILLFKDLQSAFRWMSLTVYYNEDLDKDVCEYSMFIITRKDVVEYNEIHKK